MLFKGKTFKEALQKGLEHFDVPREMAKIRVIKEGKDVLGVNVIEYELDIEPLDHITVKADGYFRILYKDDGVYLEIYPPIEGGRKVKKEDILGRLEYKKVRDYDEKAIDFALDDHKENVIKIAPPQEEFKYDAQLLVEISHDAKKAFATLLPPDGGKMITVEEAEKILEQNGVVYGIYRDKLEEVISQKMFNYSFQVASATLPVDGRDGYIDYKVSIRKDRKPKLKEDGSVDFHELNLIENVAEGDSLAELIQATEGKDGTDVRGKVLKAVSGKPVKLVKGKNTEISSDGKLLFSLIDGQINYSDGKINVFPVYEVPGNVDSATGNIRFVGNVVIRGNVITGFKIEADGDIEVSGVVEGAHLKAGGNIILKRGVQGSGKAYLYCKGNLVSKFLENCTAEVEGDILAEAIMHSNVSSKSTIEVKGRKGLIVGGNIAAQSEIDAITIGSPMATVTRIEVGVDPDLRKNIEKTNKSLEEERKNYEKINQAIVHLAKAAKQGNITADKKDMLEKIVKARAQLEESIKQKEQQRNLLKSRLEIVSRGKVNVKGKVFPGVNITIGPSAMFVKDYLEYVSFYRAEGEIKLGSYE